MGRRRKDDDGDGIEDPAAAIPLAQSLAALRLAASIGFALIAAGPGLLQAATGARDLVSALWWFLLTFLAAWAGLGFVLWVWRLYREQIDIADAMAQAEERRKQLAAARAAEARAEAARLAEAASASAEPQHDVASDPVDGLPGPMTEVR